MDQHSYMKMAEKKSRFQFLLGKEKWPKRGVGDNSYIFGAYTFPIPGYGKVELRIKCHDFSFNG